MSAVEIGRGIHVCLDMFHPLGVNAGFIVTDDGPVHVDSGMTVTTGETLLGYSQAVCNKPPVVLILTEHHGDHTFGQRPILEAGAALWAHPHYDTVIGAGRPESTPSAHTYLPDCGPVDLSDVKLRPADRTFDRRTSITVGNRELVLVPTPGHVPSQLSVFIPDEGVVFCGDTLYSGFYPTTRFGGVAQWKTWVQSLTVLIELDPRLIVPGHGRPCTVEEAKRCRAYLQTLPDVLSLDPKRRLSPSAAWKYRPGPWTGSV